MSRINRVPFGLQDFLGSQNFGDNPSELSRFVAPTLDMMRFYYPERRHYHATVAPVRVDSDEAIVETVFVPEGELWLVTQVGFVTLDNSVFNRQYQMSVAMFDAQNIDNSVYRIGFAELGISADAANAGNSTVPAVYEKAIDFQPVMASEALEFTITHSNLSAADYTDFTAFIRYLKMNI